MLAAQWGLRSRPERLGVEGQELVHAGKMSIIPNGPFGKMAREHF